MNKVGLEICDKQNLQINIQRLAAQKQLYIKGKRLFSLQLILNVLIPLLLLIVGILLKHYESNTQIDWLRVLYAVVIIILDYLFIIPEINKCKQKAATIQESFDCDVMNIEWNKILVGEKPLHEDIFRYSNEYLKENNNNVEKLENWYPTTLKSISGNIAKIICQRSNFTYDYSIREKFKNGVVFIALAILIIALFYLGAKDLGVQSCLLYFFVPYMPIASITLKLYLEHKTSLKNLESLKSNLFSTWSNLLKGEDISNQQLRQLQDKIFSNRKSNPLIPEWIYNRLRSKLEEEMYYSAEQLIEEYNQRK